MYMYIYICPNVWFEMPWWGLPERKTFLFAQRKCILAALEWLVSTIFVNVGRYLERSGQSYQHTLGHMDAWTKIKTIQLN